MAAGTDMAIRLWAAVEHETVKVRMRGVALELTHPHSTWPGCLADFRTFERARRMLRQCQPETRRLGPRGHVVPENIVRIGDPKSRRRVVGRDQDVFSALASRIEDLFGLRSDWAEVCRNAGFPVRMTLGLHSQV